MSARSTALRDLLAAPWGGSFAFIRVAAPALGAVPLAFTRLTIGAAALLRLAVAVAGTAITPKAR